MKFMLGCNYLASNAGADMWRDWNEDVIRNDLKIFAQYGVKYLRVFPNWRDFQPVMPLYEGNMRFKEFRLEGEVFANNPNFLDEAMLDKFERFCEICREFDMKLVVALMAGWISGRVYVPSALNNLDVFTDPIALLMEQKFIKGFVSRFRDNDVIYGWDLGNECNVMGNAQNPYITENWTMLISNTIRAYDNTRPVISGLTTFYTDFRTNPWTVQIQGEHNDIVTTHPYAYFRPHAKFEKKGEYRALMHGTSELKLFSDIGGKPCLTEEFGTLGPMVCSDKVSGDVLKFNMYSNWANGGLGILWWCANEQVNLIAPPYTWNMCETELGMLDKHRKPKPVLEEMKKFAEFIDSLDFELPKAKTDAVTLLTYDTDQWGIAYMTNILASQAKLNIKFAHCDGVLPDSDLYLVPSISGIHNMPLEVYDELRERVKNGADLYISSDKGMFSNFVELTGNRVDDTAEIADAGKIKGLDLEFSRRYKFYITPVTSEVLYTDEEGEPVITKQSFGKGNVYYVNFPLEIMLTTRKKGFEQGYFEIYKKLFAKHISECAVLTENPFVVVTEHYGEAGNYVVALNGTDKSVAPEFTFNGCSVKRYIKGDINSIEPYGALIFEIE